MLKALFLAAGLLLAASSASFAATDPDASAYCTRTGGTVQTRIPEYGTNGGTPLLLAFTRPFCQYVAKDGSSQISVLLDTLYTKKPTLAALAYYAEVPYNGSNCEGSPGSCYCSQIGGTDLFGGINAAGGAWVLNSNPNDQLDSCIFPDLSSIDTYGLFYHSAGIVRGRDLSKKLRYKNPN